MIISYRVISCRLLIPMAQHNTFACTGAQMCAAGCAWGNHFAGSPPSVPLLTWWIESRILHQSGYGIRSVASSHSVPRSLVGCMCVGACWCCQFPHSIPPLCSHEQLCFLCGFTSSCQWQLTSYTDSLVVCAIWLLPASHDHMGVFRTHPNRNLDPTQKAF